jgi:hypothetical protein
VKHPFEKAQVTFQIWSARDMLEDSGSQVRKDLVS